MGKSLHLLLNGKAKEIALTIPVKKRAEILNNLIVSSLIDQSLFLEIEKILDSETADEVISELPFIGNTKLVKTSRKKTLIQKKVISQKNIENLSEKKNPGSSKSDNKESKPPVSDELLDNGGFFF